MTYIPTNGTLDIKAQTLPGLTIPAVAAYPDSSYEKPACVNIGNYIYCFGADGYNQGKAYRYDITANTYLQIASLPSAFTDTANRSTVYSPTGQVFYDYTSNRQIEVVGTNIYIFENTLWAWNGSAQVPTSSIACKYDTVANTYTMLTAPPIRFNWSCTAQGQYIYFQGLTRTQFYRYNTANDTWTSRAVPVDYDYRNTYQASLIALSSLIYAFHPTNDVLAYNPTTNTWASANDTVAGNGGSIPTANGFQGDPTTTTFAGGKLMYIGPTGSTQNKNKVFYVLHYNNVSPTADSWTVKSYDTTLPQENGVGTAAQFWFPYGITVDSSGNLYVGDSYNHRIRKITSTASVTTLAGSTKGFLNGTGTAALFNFPKGIAVDSSGNVYIADSENHRIRKTTSAGVTTTLAGSGTAGYADGTGTAAQFNYPFGLAVDATGNVYVADSKNHCIRKITSTGVVTTLAGLPSGTFPDYGGYADSNGTNAKFSEPYDVTVDSAGNVYVADYGNFLIRKITPSGDVTTLAGSSSGYADGQGTAAAFYYPQGIVVDGSGNIYVADRENQRIRVINQSTGTVSTLAGSTQGFADGTGAAAQFNDLTGVARDSSGNLYIADKDNHRIRKVSSSGVVTTLAGSGVAGFADATGTLAQFNTPTSVAVDSSGNVYVSDYNNQRIRKITSAGVVTTLAGSSTAGSNNGTGASAQFNGPYAVTLDSSGNIYVAEWGNHRIRKVTSAGVVTTLAGSTQGYTDATGTSAQFNTPSGVAVDASGNVYVGDQNNNRIRKITSAGVVTTLAGSVAGYLDETGASAKFYYPRGVTVDSSGNIYVCDFYNNRIRKVSSTGIVTTVAGSGAAGFAEGQAIALNAAKFSYLTGITADSSGNLYVADQGNNRIRKITSVGDVTTFAGSSQGYLDATGTNAKFNAPTGVAVDSTGNVYVTDKDNHFIRKINATGEVTTLAGSSEGYLNNLYEHYASIVNTSGLIREPFVAVPALESIFMFGGTYSSRYTSKISTYTPAVDGVVIPYATSDNVVNETTNKTSSAEPVVPFKAGEVINNLNNRGDFWGSASIAAIDVIVIQNK